jgi:DNA-binding transcriptional ArsR family regulator
VVIGDRTRGLCVSCVLRKHVLKYTAMEEAIRAIAEPNRRRILRLVADGELSAGEIASRFEITRPAVSQHLTVLREAGLVAERREGTRRLYSLRPEGFADLRSFLEAFWDEGLERLKTAAELEEGRRRRGRRAA